MQYTKRTLVVAQSRVSEAVERAARQRDLTDRLKAAGNPADDAFALLLVMEQSLLSMKRFLAVLERDLELSLGVEKPLRRKTARHQAKAHTDELAREVVDVLRDRGIEAEISGVPASAAPTPPRTSPTDRPADRLTDGPIHRLSDAPLGRKP